ncbi:3-hydroxyisobutyrate dehydrogenase [Frondihabitans australicus]|uniref:3-hydroxyisobutyrate dehydrogenase n=1 Tax=Frondihabitans australicus TaxID=386892 RepID=A0A495ILB9_9MICO|nr:NAD(P)-dependent oxidoreductase [Frondihabitans australicus]RKR76228.1 3-hydroxyisobutyrate dehydrogenase [Frondihabitans australicus]
MKVAVLGLGIMGNGVARTLLRDGFDVAVWNRTAEKAAPLADAGATVAATAADAVEGADVILSIVFDADSVLAVLDEAGPTVPANAVWAQCSTIGLDGTKAVDAKAQELGVTLVEAMMLGTKTPAETGKLVMLAAGDAKAIEIVQPVLDSMGQKTVVAGPSIGDASALKLAANAWIATITAGTAQSLALAGALGLDANLFLDAISGGASDSPYAHVKGASMLSGDWPASFALDGLRKDIGLAGDAARGSGVDTTFLDAIDAVYARASAKGHGGDDIASVYAGFRD